MPKISFSEQLRRAIESSGTSRYALARSVGISDSALSRFMSGERGLNLTSLDKLADALGLQIVVGVQKIPRPKPRGRRPAKGAQMAAKKTKASWQRMAEFYARDAFEAHWRSRRGLWELGDVGLLCLYNNNPYAHDPTLRDKETAEFRRKLKVEGIKEVAYATYPPEGQEYAGYTYAMIIGAGEEKADWVCDTMEDILREPSRWRTPRIFNE